MIKKVFVGKSSLVSDLLDLVLPDVCGTFNTQVRGGFTYFITFITDHSQCGYVYLMKYKFEAKFKEFRPEVENQIGRKTKVLRLDKRSFTKLSLFLWGYALETATQLLNMAPSKTMAKTPYELWHNKPASYKYLMLWRVPHVPRDYWETNWIRDLVCVGRIKNKEWKTCLSGRGGRRLARRGERQLKLHELEISMHIKFHASEPLIEVVQAIMNIFGGEGNNVLLGFKAGIELRADGMGAYLARR
ncbi:hypothetical protein Sango_0012000 [Sesamum angolense]|uniref:Uncharacterized protein n=1 Tax=Sesamum angolense TaxID=2727404 RepID=A0AAE1XCR8_9LAMI|nr:hypothetical protein Sango_0012000 [Sesamum angolense]